MSLFSYYEPFLSISDVERLFDDAFGPFDRPLRSAARLLEGSQASGEQRVQSFRPKMDVREGPDNKLVATFELPGLKKEDVKIDLQGNTLQISGEAKFEEDKEENGWVVKERRRGRFSRTVPLPEGTQPEAITANMENGVLTVTYPKTTPQQEAKRIAIN